MTHALTLDSRLVAEDLYRFLCDLDPAQVRQQIEQELQLRAHRLRTELRRIQQGHSGPTGTEGGPAVWERIREVAELFERHLPRPELSPSELRIAWESFRQDALPAYERLAASLAGLDIHVPSLRPTNYKRNLYHLCNGVGVCLLIEWVLDLRGMVLVAGSLAVAAWTVEISRRFLPSVNHAAMWVFQHIAHPHETWRVNSATWFTTAMLMLALLQDKTLATLAVIILGFADPAAALVGRRFGRIRLIHGRSLEGSMTFVVVGMLAGTAALVLFHPELTVPRILTLAGVGATAGAVAELFSRRIDDNLSIPVAAALAGLLVTVLLGG